MIFRPCECLVHTLEWCFTQLANLLPRTCHMARIPLFNSPQGLVTGSLTPRRSFVSSCAFSYFASTP